MVPPRHKKGEGYVKPMPHAKGTMRVVTDCGLTDYLCAIVLRFLRDGKSITVVQTINEKRMPLLQGPYNQPLVRVK